MRELILSPHSLLPHASAVRKEQSVILDELIKYMPLAAARLRSLEARRGQSPDAAIPAPAADGCSNPTASSSASPSPSRSSFSSSSSTSSNSGGDAVGRAAAAACPRPRKRTRSTRSDGGGGGGQGDGSTGDRMDCDIRVAPEPTSSVAIRVRGDRRTCLSPTPGGPPPRPSCSPPSSMHLVRSTHCRDGSKRLHHSESKIREEVDRTPGQLKARLEELAGKLHGMRRTPGAGKSPPDQCNAVEEDSI